MLAQCGRAWEEKERARRAKGEREHYRVVMEREEVHVRPSLKRYGELVSKEAIWDHIPESMRMHPESMAV